MTRKKSHHHGNLRAALVDAGFEMLSEGEEISLRKLAARAGVSHAAPAHHFQGLQGLLLAIAERAFDEFTTIMIECRDAAPNEPKARLLAISEGYIEFARNHGALFQLMFNNSAKRDQPPDAPVYQAASRAYQVLQEACIPFATNENECLQLESLVWSLVHGYVSLFLDKPPTPSPILPFEELLERLLHTWQSQ